MIPPTTGSDSAEVDEVVTAEVKVTFSSRTGPLIRRVLNGEEK
jgi:hypothetical protein